MRLSAFVINWTDYGGMNAFDKTISNLKIPPKALRRRTSEHPTLAAAASRSKPFCMLLFAIILRRF